MPYLVMSMTNLLNPGAGAGQAARAARPGHAVYLNAQAGLQGLESGARAGQ